MSYILMYYLLLVRDNPLMVVAVDEALMVVVADKPLMWGGISTLDSTIEPFPNCEGLSVGNGLGLITGGLKVIDGDRLSIGNGLSVLEKTFAE
ncbi:hypothetical protein NRH13_000049 [Proteus mirabilis]|uniref:hypothetical protein n=1 Tax=Proteus mirabilis TaxID=584 RepID=UPI0031CFFB1A